MPLKKSIFSFQSSSEQESYTRPPFTQPKPSNLSGAHSTPVVHSGYLIKLKSSKQLLSLHFSKRLYFVLLSSGELQYYHPDETTTERDLLGAVNVRGMTLQWSLRIAGKHNVMRLESAASEHGGTNSTKKCVMYFQALDREDADTWKKHFIDVGVVWNEENELDTGRDSSIGYSPSLQRLGALPVDQWTVPDVVKWTSFVLFDPEEHLDVESRERTGNRRQFKKLRSLSKERIREHDVNGRKLILLYNPENKEVAKRILGIQDDDLLQRVQQLIQELSENGNLVDLDYYNVQEKTLSCPFVKKRSIKEFEETTHNLCKPQHMLRSYLNIDSVSATDLYKWAINERDNSGALTTRDQTQPLLAPPEEPIDKTRALNVPVKLLITELFRDKTTQAIRSVVSPFLVRNQSTTYGIYHTAVIVGCWLLDWNDNGLCIPRQLKSSMALLSIDIGTIRAASKQDFCDRFLLPLASTICEWNSTRSYRLINLATDTGNDLTNGNCQQFAEAVLNKIGIKPQFKEVVDQYLHKMRDKGFSKPFLPVSSAMAKHLNILREPIRFKTHNQLDEFVNNMLRQCPDFDTRFPGEWALLKAFDRAFWLRLHQNSSDKKQRFSPATIQDDKGGSVCKCPFGEPHESGSFINPLRF